MGRAPGPPWWERAVAGYVQDDDPKLAGIERRAGALGQRAIKRIGVVRHEHHGDMRVLAAQVVGQAQRGRLAISAPPPPGPPAPGKATAGTRGREQVSKTRRDLLVRARRHNDAEPPPYEEGGFK